MNYRPFAISACLFGAAVMVTAASAGMIYTPADVPPADQFPLSFSATGSSSKVVQDSITGEQHIVYPPQPILKVGTEK